MATDAQLYVLEQLGYVLECLAQGVGGEAKSEADRLAKLLETDERFAIDGREAIAERVRQARAQLFGSANKRAAANELAKLNRELWKQVLPA